MEMRGPDAEIDNDSGRVAARIDDERTTNRPAKYRPSRYARLRTLDDLDGRTRAARIARELVTALENELGASLSSAKQELVKRAALLGAMVEDFEANWLEGKTTDLVTYGMLADRQRRILESLGLARNPAAPFDGTPRALAALQGSRP